MGEEPPGPNTRSITSEGLGSRAVIACWAVAVILLGSGIVATFLAGTGAAPAAMILFGSLFLILGLMRRVPLNLEVAGAKIDASYELVADKAFDAGRNVGRQQGVELAIDDVEKAEETGQSPQEILERLRDSWSFSAEFPLPSMPPEERTNQTWTQPVKGYSASSACSAAKVSHRQLDYWTRSRLVPPSARKGDQHLYTMRDIVMLVTIRRLLDAGVSLQQIRTAVQHLRERPLASLEDVTFMSDGASVYEATQSDEVLDLLQSGQGMFGISVGGVMREVRKALEDLPSVDALGPEDGPPDPARARLS